MFLTAFSCVQRVLGLGWDKRLLMDEGSRQGWLLQQFSSHHNVLLIFCTHYTA